MRKAHLKFQKLQRLQMFQPDGPQRTGPSVRGLSIHYQLGHGWRLARLRCSSALSRVLISGSLAGIGMGALGCSGDAATAPPAQVDSHVFWALQLNQHAVNLALQAPYNTMQLTATPLTVAGTPLAGVGGTTFHGSDSTVTVNAKTGLMTAHYATALTKVIATLQVQGVTLADTVYVQVTDITPPSALATLSLQPVLGDSAKRSVDFVFSNGLSWPVTATDVAHHTICSANGGCPLLIYYTSSNPKILYNSNNQLSGGFQSGAFEGQTVLTATTWAYGVARQDSVVFTVGSRLNYQIIIQNNGLEAVFQGAAEPKKVVLGVGAIVQFWNRSDEKQGITFVDPTGMDTATSVNPYTGDEVSPNGSGDIAVFGTDTITGTGIPCSLYIQSLGTCNFSDTDFRTRRFPIARTYKFFRTKASSDTFELDIR